MENRGNLPAGPGDRSPIPLILLWAAIGLVFMAALIGAVVWLVASIPIWFPDFPELVPASAAGRSVGLLAASVTAAALMGAGAVGAVGILRQRSTERTHQLERKRHELEQSRHDAELVSRLRDRYAQAAEQLGNGNAAVRLAGVYAIAGLADDWIACGERSEAQICVDLLCAYQRVPRPAADTQEAARAELEVRQTITRVITGHLQDPDDDVSWCGMDFDFTGTTFDAQHSFTGVHFTGGDVSFREAQFIDGITRFTQTHFSGGDVSFYRACFTGGVISFYGARFSGGSVDFTEARFIGGSVYFTEARFTGSAVVHDEAHFTGGTITYNYAHFTGGTVAFNWAHFIDGTVNFTDADFTRGVVEFTVAHFTGGTVQFLRAKGHADGPWGDDLPDRWPARDEITFAEPWTAEVEDGT